MINLYQFVIDDITSVTSRVYPERADSDALFPYVVIKFPTINELDHNQDQVILEIDVWHKIGDGNDILIEIENLTDAIDKLFKGRRNLDENYLLMFQRLNRLSIPDEDSSIKRRQLRYAIKTYKKEN